MLKATLKRLLYWDVIARLAVSAELLNQGWLGIFHPESLAFQILRFPEEAPRFSAYGWISSLMLIFSLIVALDVFINDILPNDRKLEITRRFHNVVYMVPGGLFLAQAYIASAADTVVDDAGLVTAYSIRAAVCALIAIRYAIGRFSASERRIDIERRVTSARPQ